jgi:hypothetical protein
MEWGVGNSVDSRDSPRIRTNFLAKIKIMPTSTEVDGVAINLSQSGAFISSTSWSAFQSNDQAEIELLLPAEFTGQEDALLLRGQATVKRVERDRWGIAVEFHKQLKTFDVSRIKKAKATT